MMLSVGERLREARLAQGLDLNTVVARTKIAEKFLKAIEADDRKCFPSGFFYKSFVDQYARALSVDTGEIDEQISAILSAEAPLPLPGQGDQPVVRVAPLVVRSRSARSRTYASLAAFVLVLVGCSGFYAWWRNLNARVASGPANHTPVLQTSARPKAIPAPNEATRHESAQVPVTEERAAALPVSLTPEETRQQPPRETSREVDALSEGVQPEPRLLVELMARKETWLAISSDGLMIFKGTLGPNESKKVEGKEFAKLRVNNPAALDVKLNGKQLGPLGPPDRFLVVVFTRDKYHVLDSAKESD